MVLIFEIKKKKYKICQFCNHVNGLYNETKKFFEKIYVDKKGKNFTAGYKDNNFDSKVKNIYLPKIIFLKKNYREKKYTRLRLRIRFFPVCM